MDVTWLGHGCFRLRGRNAAAKSGAQKPQAGPGATETTVIDGLTPEQRVFVGWAQVWCENATDQDFRRRAQEDVHAPGRWRANGVLQNSEDFRKAFGCSAGTPMAPRTTCRVW